jgi:hypothetical protein
MAEQPAFDPDQTAKADAEAGAQNVDVSQSKSPHALSKLARQLGDSELRSSGAKKLLLADRDRLEQEVNELKGYRIRFFEADKQLAVALQRLKASFAADVISGVCLTIGGAVLGLIPSFSDNLSHVLTFAVISIVLLVTGIAAKRVSS